MRHAGYESFFGFMCELNSHRDRPGQRIASPVPDADQQLHQDKHHGPTWPVLTGFPSLLFQFQCELLTTAIRGFPRLTLTFPNINMYGFVWFSKLGFPYFPRLDMRFSKVVFPRQAPVCAITCYLIYSKICPPRMASAWLSAWFRKLGFSKVSQAWRNHEPKLGKPCLDQPPDAKKPAQWRALRFPPVVDGQPSGRVLIGHPQRRASATA